jgi:hypothetical protein
MLNYLEFEAEPFAYAETDQETSWWDTITSWFSPAAETTLIHNAIQQGQRDVNQLTNLVFFKRHPERQGRGLTRDEPNFSQLSREWLGIRDQLVAPALNQAVTPTAPPASSPYVPSRGRQASAPPTEGPLKGVTGTRCANGSGKCWPGSGRASDIVDSDVPWNDAAHRSPANYAAVLDYFNVDNPGNARYARDTYTYCNIFAHDATRAMWASVPHWVRTSSGGWNELNANATVDWMRTNSRNIGWVQIDAALCQWLAQQFSRRQSIPYADTSVPSQIILAGGQIAAANHPNPALLAQPSYAAQGFANLGLPTVILWKNPTGGHGHMALVRPETASARGQVDSGTGIFVPRSAQAGSTNFRNGLASWITMSGARGPNGALFYVHA